MTWQDIIGIAGLIAGIAGAGISGLALYKVGKIEELLHKERERFVKKQNIGKYYEILKMAITDLNTLSFAASSGRITTNQKIKDIPALMSKINYLTNNFCDVSQIIEEKEYFENLTAFYNDLVEFEKNDYSKECLSRIVLKTEEIKMMLEKKGGLLIL